MCSEWLTYNQESHTFDTRCPICKRGDLGFVTDHKAAESLMNHLAWHAAGMPIDGIAPADVKEAFNDAIYILSS